MAYPYQYLLRPLWQWARQSMGFLWMMALAAYLVTLAGNAIYRNYQSQETMRALREELAEVQRDRQRLEISLAYYKTDAFLQKEARRVLIVRHPDEKMYALPESSVIKTEKELADSNRKAEAARQAQHGGESWRQWADYLQGKK